MYAALLSDLSRSLLNIPLEPEDFLTKSQEVAGPRTPDNEELSSGQRTGHERAHLTAVPPDGCPVDFSALFMQPTGAYIECNRSNLAQTLSLTLRTQLSCCLTVHASAQSCTHGGSDRNAKPPVLMTIVLRHVGDFTGTAMEVPSPSPAAEAPAPAVAPSGATALLTTHTAAGGAVGGRDPDSRDYSTWNRSEEDQFYAVLVSHSCHTVKTVCDVAQQRIGTKTLPQVCTPSLLAFRAGAYIA